MFNGNTTRVSRQNSGKGQVKDDQPHREFSVQRGQDTFEGMYNLIVKI